jgi:hypothetical protein
VLLHSGGMQERQERLRLRALLPEKEVGVVVVEQQEPKLALGYLRSVLERQVRLLEEQQERQALKEEPK